MGNMARTATVFGGAVLLGTAIAGSVSAADHANTATDGPALKIGCDQKHTAKTAGGRAQWHTRCGDDTIQISGVVQDTKKDGTCAFVQARNKYQADRGPQACGYGHQETFLFALHGSSAKVFLVIGRY